MAYRAVLFDLFDTLVIFDRERLPLCEVGGRQVRSTIGCLHELLGPVAPGLTIEACYEALLESWRDAERERSVDHREVPAPVRFGRWLERLAIDPAACPSGLVERLVDRHKIELSRAAHFPAHHVDLLERLARRFRLAVVSNFDWTPTALGILDSAGVTALFDAIVVSDEVGWRKPKRDIFDIALERVGVAAPEALFVGDRADIDVLGAHEAGMATAWINRNGEPLPPGIAAPAFTIRDLAELGPILGA
jgi:HAD superfamily hydrolase (TIGR01549 family)